MMRQIVLIVGLIVQKRVFSTKKCYQRVQREGFYFYICVVV